MRTSPRRSHLFVRRSDEAAEPASALWPFHYQRGYYDEARELV